MADDKIKEGDIVRYQGELFRANVLCGKSVHIANINGATKVLASELIYIGEDTLSAIAIKEMGPKPTTTKKHNYRWRIGDFVRNDKLMLSGEVLENKNGKTKVEVCMDDGGFKLYWWPQEEMSTEHKLYNNGFGGTTPTDLEEWRKRQRPYTPYTPPSSAYTPMGQKKPKPKPPSLGISTAGLIKKEVSKLESEQKSKPLKTNAPTKKKDNDIFEGPSKPVPKRKGDW